jgi:hypothetical protein
LAAQEAAPAPEAAVDKVPYLSVTVCVWAKCSNNLTRPFQPFTGNGAGVQIAIEDAIAKARIGIPCPQPYQVVLHKVAGEVATQCPESYQRVTYELTSPTCDPWTVRVVCRSLNGNEFEHTVSASTFCEAYLEAKRLASFGAELDGGVCSCCWQVKCKPQPKKGRWRCRR